MEALFVAIALAVLVALATVALQSRRPRVATPGSVRPAPERYVVFDLETTGLDFQRSEIIEIGAIKVEGDTQETFQMLVKPKRRVPGPDNGADWDIARYGRKIGASPAVGPRRVFGLYRGSASLLPSTLTST